MHSSGQLEQANGAPGTTSEALGCLYILKAMMWTKGNRHRMEQGLLFPLSQKAETLVSSP